MTSIPSAKLLIKLGDGGNPEAFAAPCGLVTKSFNRSANAVETVVPDCDNPDDPATIERSIASVDWQVSGSFTMDAEDYDDSWDDWWMNDGGSERNVQIIFDEPRAVAGRTYQGPAVLTQFNITAELGGKLKGEMTIMGAGALSRTLADA